MCEIGEDLLVAHIEKQKSNNHLLFVYPGQEIPQTGSKYRFPSCSRCANSQNAVHMTPGLFMTLTWWDLMLWASPGSTTTSGVKTIKTGFGDLFVTPAARTVCEGSVVGVARHPTCMWSGRVVMASENKQQQCIFLCRKWKMHCSLVPVVVVQGAGLVMHPEVWLEVRKLWDKEERKKEIQKNFVL